MNLDMKRYNSREMKVEITVDDFSENTSILDLLLMSKICLRILKILYLIIFCTFI